MLRNVLLALLIVISWTQAIAQTQCNLEFSGRILDEANQPMIGAAIILLPGQKGVATDQYGKFAFKNLCPGTYTVQIRYIGYEDLDFQITIQESIERDIKLDPVITELESITIRDHHDVSHTENAINFVQLDERMIAEFAGKTLGETLKNVSGVNSIQSGPGIFKPVIHGVHSDRVLILNHGLRQEGQTWGAEHAPEIDPFIASNIVVIKDASAIKYGTNALGGVIVVNPPELPVEGGLTGHLNTVLQSNGRSGVVSGMLQGTIGKIKGFGWRVQGTGKQSGDFETPNYSLTNTGIKELNYSAALGYHKEKVGLDLFFSHFETELGILKGTAIATPEDLRNAMESDVPLYTTDFSYNIGEPRQKVSHNLLKFNGHYLTNAGDWRLQYGFQNNKRKEFDIRRGNLSSIPAINLELNTHTLDLEFETEHSDARTISIGINSMLQNNYNIFGTQRIPFIPNFTNISSGIFGVGKLFIKRFTIDMGLRYDIRHYDVAGFDFKNSKYTASFSFHNLSATLGTRIDLGKNQLFAFSVSTAWRPPNVAELFSLGRHQSAASIEFGLLLQDTTNEVTDIEDIDFQNERSLKIVSTYQWDHENFRLELSPYMNYILNYIYLRPAGITRNLSGTYPYFRYEQTDAVFLGVDISANWKAHRNFSIMPKISLLRAQDISNNDRLIYIPSNKYDLTLRYEKSQVSTLRRFYFESKGLYVAKQNHAPRVITVAEILDAEEQGIDLFGTDPSMFDFQDAPDGYFLWNIAAGVSFRKSRVQYDLRFAVENVLDERYREYTNRLRYFADDIGRDFVISLKVIF